MRVLGLMSGTSADAVDQAVVDFGPVRDGVLPARLVWHGEMAWGEAERGAVLALLPPATADIARVHRVHQLVGHRFAAAARQAVDAAGPVDLVVSHGQTVHHWVEQGRALGSFQLGQPAWIAQELGVAVLSDLRAADIAAGGQGAPLVPVLDQLLFGNVPTAVLNLGGIANVTVVGIGRAVAGDTGPANCLMDLVAARTTGQACDQGGRLAAAGTVDQALLRRMLADPWFGMGLPRSTGREYFSSHWLDQMLQGGDPSPQDLEATLLELTARSIADVLAGSGVQRTVVSGGGTRNPVLMARLAQLLDGVVTSDEVGLPSSAKEAVWCALAGWLSAHGLPGQALGADGSVLTGARHATVLGSWCGPGVAALLARSITKPARMRRPRTMSLACGPHEGER